MSPPAREPVIRAALKSESWWPGRGFGEVHSREQRQAGSLSDTFSEELAL
jgi:hypothetical protein